MKTTAKEKVWKGREKPLCKWIWRCPIKGCNAKGIKPLSHYKAQAIGRTHIRRKHYEKHIRDNGKKRYPLLEKKE